MYVTSQWVSNQVINSVNSVTIITVFFCIELYIQYIQYIKHMQYIHTTWSPQMSGDLHLSTSQLRGCTLK